MNEIKNILEESVEHYCERHRVILSRLSLLPKGRIRKKTIKSNNYFYLQYRKGEKVVDEYIGKSVPDDLKEKLILRKSLEEELVKVKESLALLHTDTLPDMTFIEPIRKILEKLTEIDLWESGIEIVGTWCFLIYQKYLDFEKYPLRTQDLDILIPYPYKGMDFNFFNFLKDLGFEERFNNDGSTYYTGGSLKIEFLAPRTKQKPARTLKKLAVNPQYLNLVELLVKESVLIKISAKIKVKLPSPESFFLHKLLLAQVKQRSGKQEKDIRQALHTGKYIFKNKTSRENLIKLWYSISGSWQKKIKKSLLLCSEVVPTEQPIIEQIRDLLN